VFASICFFVAVAAHPAIAHPGAAIVVDAKGQVYFVDTGQLSPSALQVFEGWPVVH
jgi:predicted transcriptional regulator